MFHEKYSVQSAIDCPASSAMMYYVLWYITNFGLSASRPLMIMCRSWHSTSCLVGCFYWWTQKEKVTAVADISRLFRIDAKRFLGVIGEDQTRRQLLDKLLVTFLMFTLESSVVPIPLFLYELKLSARKWISLDRCHTRMSRHSSGPILRGEMKTSTDCQARFAMTIISHI